LGGDRAFPRGKLFAFLKKFHEAKPRTLYLDRGLDRAAGQELTSAERSARVREIAQEILDYAVTQRR
jgi:hypothetical protein